MSILTPSGLSQALKRNSVRSSVWIGVLFVIFLFLRIINIDNTARFTQDESSDLLRMQQYWQTKKITLVGPLSTDNTKVFGSLTYYMLLPFAVIGGFDPVSPVYGTAFWGAVTALLVVLITKRVNKPLMLWSIVFGCIWYPLLETSRWAWNPHLVIFWVGLGLLISMYKKGLLWLFLTGLFLGLSIHHHYIAFFATFAFIFIELFIYVKQKKFKYGMSLLAGYIAAILPFIIFDLRHPPGLFIGRYLLGGATPHVAQISSFIELFSKTFSSIHISALTISRNSLFAGLTIMGTVLLILSDVVTRSRLWLRYLIPVICQILVGMLLTAYETRYFLPALLFYFMWLIQQRKGLSYFSQRLLLVIVLVSSAFTFYPQLTESQSQPSIRIIREATNYINSVYQKSPIKNINITTTASPDSDLLALKYRDVLSLKHVPLKAPSEYDATENLFVFSTSISEMVRADASVPLQIFKNAKQVSVHSIENSPWKVYWLSF